MCFSTEASFISGAVLSIIGIATIKKAQTPAQIIFAGIPLLFAVQQIAEGFVWLSFSNATFGPWHQFFTYLFLLFAQVIWPTWVPLSIFLLEKDRKSAKPLQILLLIGILLSIILAFRLSTETITSAIVEHHIKYTFNNKNYFYHFTGIFYVLVSVFPPFFSQFKKMSLLGWLIFISFGITVLFYGAHIISVWCFFSALMSVAVYYILLNIVDSTKEKHL